MILVLYRNINFTAITTAFILIAQKIVLWAKSEAFTLIGEKKILYMKHQ